MYVADLHYNIKLTLQIILKGKMFTILSLGKGGSEVHYAIGLLLPPRPVLKFAQKSERPENLYIWQLHVP